MWQDQNDGFFANDSQYIIEMEVSDMREDDIRINLLRNGQIEISGERHFNKDRQRKGFRRSQSSYDSFSRTLSLPPDADRKNMEVNFAKSILTLTIPRKEGLRAAIFLICVR